MKEKSSQWIDFWISLDTTWITTYLDAKHFLRLEMSTHQNGRHISCAFARISPWMFSIFSNVHMKLLRELADLNWEVLQLILSFALRLCFGNVLFWRRKQERFCQDSGKSLKIEFGKTYLWKVNIEQKRLTLSTSQDFRKFNLIKTKPLIFTLRQPPVWFLELHWMLMITLISTISSLDASRISEGWNTLKGPCEGMENSVKSSLLSEDCSSLFSGADPSRHPMETEDCVAGTLLETSGVVGWTDGGPGVGGSIWSLREHRREAGGDPAARSIWRPPRHPRLHCDEGFCM